ncbi:MAG: cobalt-precorrin-5B (C(1))-methyltransferase, partial [Hyphomicrobiaceae bacterium]|nr:cobalt-precorrin-5B (C(1))-methyltransferase [Hyphomicrobiaceae bacterium]
MAEQTSQNASALRRGWTTGACATAATRAALTALLDGTFPDPVEITLPKGETPAFALALEETGEGWARAGIVKDAGDDPDVTHGALIISTVRRGAENSGVSFRAGEGVGTVTKPGLPIEPGEPAINPVPRMMIREMVEAVTGSFGVLPDIEVEISVPGGAGLAEKTWNPRLGIEGGISILGTTGIVHPYSTAAFRDSVIQGIQVAANQGQDTVALTTGGRTEKFVIRELPELAPACFVQMGDFLKYAL